LVVASLAACSSTAKPVPAGSTGEAIGTNVDALADISEAGTCTFFTPSRLQETLLSKAIDCDPLTDGRLHEALQGHQCAPERYGWSPT
jgi:hypothetical protein